MASDPQAPGIPGKFCHKKHLHLSSLEFLLAVLVVSHCGGTGLLAHTDEFDYSSKTFDLMDRILFLIYLEDDVFFLALGVRLLFHAPLYQSGSNQKMGTMK